MSEGQITWVQCRGAGCKGSVTILALWLCAQFSADAFAGEPAALDLTRVPIPKLQLRGGDSLDPLPAGAPTPSSDPRNFEGIWVALGAKQSADGSPPPYLPAVKAELQRLMDLDRRGQPTVAKGTLCRPGTVVDVAINQFPTQILQRPDEILFIAEEGRSIWRIFLDRPHPKTVKLSLSGDHVGHWEGNTLVVDSIGFRATPIQMFGGGNSSALHVVTRIARANTGDPRNGDRLVISRTIDDPRIYSQPWTQIGVARWRPDLDMLEFNCEESPPDVAAEGLTVN
jgi:hypothetical protein